MPIGDLLAQISGDKSTARPTPALKRTNSIPSKRKPDDDLRGDDSKTSRRLASPGGVGQTPRSGGDRSTLQQPYTGSARPGNACAGKVVGSTPKSAKPGLPSRPAPLSAAAAPKAPPKRGSFAEILARGQRAQATMGQVGKIQHKKVEKGATKKARDEPAPATSSKAQNVGGYTGTSKPGQRNGVNGHKRPPPSHPTDTRRAGARPLTARDKAAAAAAAAAEEEAAKKVKKAAQATTGYTGTARPKPGNPTRKKDVPRGGALLNAPRHSTSHNSRYEDDYDEELDDFIDYDDEEDEGGPRHDYDSEGSSDMEAGLDELDKEERRAEFIGRKEDEEEERREKSLKAAKEDRKRKALEALRARRR